jgi:hypothetical protein
LLNSFVGAGGLLAQDWGDPGMQHGTLEDAND